MSLVEVLVSCAIMVVGLLSLAALIPVGLFQAAQAARADSASAIGRAAWRTIKVADMLRDRRTDGVGQYWCVNPLNGNLVRNCVEPMPFYPFRDDVVTTAALNNWVSSGPAVGNAGAYVIDPYGLSSVDTTINTGPAAMGVFPAMHTATPVSESFATTSLATRSWLPRLSLMERAPVNMSAARALSGDVARRLMLGTDDATYDYLPVATDYGRPVRSMTATTVGTNDVLDGNSSMHFDGNYSWMITVSPIFREPNPSYAINGSGMTIPQFNREYTVSVAVFHKRTPPVVGGVFPRNEECRARVADDSDPYGRQVRLIWDNVADLDEIPKLRAKDWVMLYGFMRESAGYVNNTHRFASDGAPFLPTGADTPIGSVTFPATRLLVAKWCQVQASDSAYLTGGNAEQTLSLKGSDFDTVSGLGGDIGLGEWNDGNIYAATMPNVVGVFEKTIRLE